MTLQDTIRALPDEEFAQLKSWIVTAETDRRAALPAVEQAQADIVTELQDAGKLEKPEVATEEQAKEDAAKVPEWQDPGTRHDLMYHYGDVVRFEGKLVRSTHQGLNSWAPGTLGFDGRIWEVIDTPETEPETSETGETEVPEWQPNLNVKPGERYTFQGETYEVVQPHTSAAHWPPNAVPALYKKV